MNGFSSGGPDFPPISGTPSASFIGMLQHAAIAVSGAWSAAYFVAQSRRGAGARRLAAGVLALLFAAITLEAVAGLPVASTATEVARRTPLLLATVSVACIVSYRPGGAR